MFRARFGEEGFRGAFVVRGLTEDEEFDEDTEYDDDAELPD